MGPIAGPELVAAVSNAGGLGVLGCTSMSLGQARASRQPYTAHRFGQFYPIAIRPNRPNGHPAVP
ncbi:MAG: nitronate monooxygenase [Acidimicrobiales bacterium]